MQLESLSDDPNVQAGEIEYGQYIADDHGHQQSKRNMPLCSIS